MPESCIERHGTNKGKLLQYAVRLCLINRVYGVRVIITTKRAVASVHAA